MNECARRLRNENHSKLRLLAPGVRRPLCSPSTRSPAPPPGGRRSTVRTDRNRILRAAVGHDSQSILGPIPTDCLRRKLGVWIAVALASVTASSTAAARRFDSSVRLDRSSTTSVSASTPAHVLDAFNKLPLPFVENKGQLDP